MANATRGQQVVIIINATSDFAQALARLLAAKGAKLVLNYPPASDGSRATSLPGSVVTIQEHLRDGDKIVEAAVKSYGTVDSLIVNHSFQGLGALNDIQNQRAWDSLLKEVLKGSFKSTKAVWPLFRSKKEGNIIFVDSDAASDSPSFVRDASQFALFGLSETLSKEGAKYGIKVNTVSPQRSHFVTGQLASSGSDISRPIVSLTATLATENISDTSGSLLEVSAQGIAKQRWERTQGVSLNPDQNFNAAALATVWNDVDRFDSVSYPTAPRDFGEVLPKTQALPPSKKLQDPVFKGKVAVVTGGGSGLGRCYSLVFAKLGAAVVVNDMKDPSAVVNEITRDGGEAFAVVASVVDGEQIIQKTLEKYGHIDILVNNAGFVRDKSFANMSEDLWDAVIDVHLDGTYQMIKAAWPHFVSQKGGVVINTTSTSGIYGVFGQANYSTAKLGILGLSEATARAGLEHNIRVNTIAPVASTGGLAVALSNTNDKNKAPVFKPEYIVPIVIFLTSDQINGVANQTTGGLFETACGWHAATRLRPSLYVGLSTTRELTPESLAELWDDAQKGRSSPVLAGNEVLKRIERLKAVEVPQHEYTFTDLEVILYNLSVGAMRSELSFVYEGSKDFQPIPTFGVIPYFTDAVINHHSEFLPNFKPTNSLLGEVYLEILQTKLPTSGRLSSTRRLIEVLDKDNAAVAVTGYTTSDTATGQKLFYNELALFMKGTGGFGGQRERLIRGPSSRLYAPPSRKPDQIAVYRTSEEQAALYRLTGDRMRMHIDPSFSGQAGFKVPILHGMCFMGIAARHLFLLYGAFKSIKVRVSGVVLPGQTLQTEIWRDAKEQDLVIFQVRVVETGKLCISGGSIRLGQPERASRM